jgi:hypothetical protein
MRLEAQGPRFRERPLLAYSVEKLRAGSVFGVIGGRE